MGHFQDYIRPSAFGTFSQRWALNTITLAKRDDLLALQVHNRLLSLPLRVCRRQTVTTVSRFLHRVKTVRRGR
jgi:hypothetical protein